MANDLDSVINIISKNINEEFARKVSAIIDEEISKNTYDIYELENDIEDLELQIDYLEDISDKYDELCGKIVELKNYYNVNADGTDFYNGIDKALEWIN